jgi:hypothetical protein
VKLLLAVTLAAFGVALAPGSTSEAVPGFCPPVCDAIPDSAWIAPTSIPLYPVYRWPGLPGLAVTAHTPRFAFEDVCVSPRVAGDPRDYAVAARATVSQLPGHWQLQAQVLHWRGDTAQNGPIARAVVHDAASRLRSCQATAPLASPSLTTVDGERIAAVISVAGQKVVHQYLLAHPASGTVVELAMWSAVPPQVPWPAVPDAEVLDALAAPLCEAYLGSCR